MVLIDALLMTKPHDAARRAEALAAAGVDGIFTPDRHLAEVTLPRIRSGLEAAKRARSDITVVGQAIMACATDPAAQADVDIAARWMVAFYGSTPAYLPVLETENRDHLHLELRALSRQGRWDEINRRSATR